MRTSSWRSGPGRTSTQRDGSGRSAAEIRAVVAAPCASSRRSAYCPRRTSPAWRAGQQCRIWNRVSMLGHCAARSAHTVASTGCSRPSPPPSVRSRTSTTRRTRTRLARPWLPSLGSTARSIPRPSKRSSMTKTSCWHSSTSPPSLDPPADHQPHRVDFRDGAAADEGHQGSWQPGRRAGHGLQVGRVSPGPLAGRERTSPRRPRPSRSPLRTWPPRRAPRDPRGVRTKAEPWEGPSYAG